MNVAPPDPSQPQGTQASFGALLQQYRLAAGLSQEMLAERARISVQGLSALENGKRQTPYRHTVTLLAQALGLTASEAAALEAAVRRARTPASGKPPTARGEDALPAANVLTFVPAPPGPRSDLPVQPTSFIGREREQAEVVALLGRVRLLTLTGSGGVGKTRLALVVAGDLVDQYPAGVWLVELAALAEPGLVPGTAAQILGVREEVGRPLTASIADHLKEKRLLLVLDNCEHLVAACAALASALLRTCPHLHILATSREALEVAGEHRYRVPSLPVPDLTHLPPPERLVESAAVALFLARAQERRADFALTAQNAQAVAQVCVRLDGIPLAMELAAARVDSLSVEGIAARLDNRFRLLTGGARDALPRQRTLRATLDWSYDLLSEPEQALLDRLAVFAGGWTLAAAEAVCVGEGVEGWEVLDLLGSLVNKSLVQTEEAGGEVRYELLETVRQYGQERLAVAGGAAAVRDRHLAWCLALAEKAAPHLTGPEQGGWLTRLETEHDNLRAALVSARETGADELGLRLAAALSHFWYIRSYCSEGRGWLEAALARGGSAWPTARARALNGAGNLARQQGDNRGRWPCTRKPWRCSEPWKTSVALPARSTIWGLRRRGKATMGGRWLSTSRPSCFIANWGTKRALPIRSIGWEMWRPCRARTGGQRRYTRRHWRCAVPWGASAALSARSVNWGWWRAGSAITTGRQPYWKRVRR
jgi:predicted ATPase/transcriptional regulator with XRE-family HTH domain